MHLNSQVRQFDGFAQWQRVFGRTPKMPTGAVYNPHFGDFTNPVEEPTAETHHLSGTMRQIRKSSLTSYFSGASNLALNKRIRASENEEFFLCQTVFLAKNRKTKGERRRLGPGVSIGRFGGKYELVHFRCAYLEVDLDDMRSGNRLLEVLGRDGALQLHLPSTNPQYIIWWIPRR